MLNDHLDSDLALADVYDALDRAKIDMTPLVRDFIYAICRLSYARGVTDGARMFYEEAKSVGKL